VVVLVNSSGGVVSAYGLAAAQLERVKVVSFTHPSSSSSPLNVQATGLKLTVCVDEMAASGGYLMACVGDRVVASPFATLGSIGVVAMAPNAYERLQREGLRVDDVTAGKYKRTLTPYRKWNAADQAAMQKDVDSIHEVFKGFVKRHRPLLNINEVATGQVGVGV
jgi:serine protease SohB